MQIYFLNITSTSSIYFLLNLIYSLSRCQLIIQSYCLKSLCRSIEAIRVSHKEEGIKEVKKEGFRSTTIRLNPP